ncbi:MAG: glutaredoxin family protein [Caldisericota bacterium]|nr:glutaredoxin family protein [Caldisericota bacterium]
MLEPNHVNGTLTKHRILMYTLSTCGWCRRTKALLQELGVAYDYVDVDLQTGGNRELAKEELLKWNPASSFPTIIIDGDECIIGFQEDRLRELASA